METSDWKEMSESEKELAANNVVTRMKNREELKLVATGQRRKSLYAAAACFLIAPIMGFIYSNITDDSSFSMMVNLFTPMIVGICCALGYYGQRLDAIVKLIELNESE